MPCQVQGKRVRTIWKEMRGFQDCAERYSLQGTGAPKGARGETAMKEMLEANASGLQPACDVSKYKEKGLQRSEN